jgi:hypothetical protein
VPACTVSASAAAASGNSGTGVVVASLYRGDGLTQQHAFAEVAELLITADGQGGGGGATAGGEPWQYAGDYAAGGVLGHDWPGYSGALASGNVVDSQARGANLLTNSGFEDFTLANVPDGWTMGGTPGTHFGSEASAVHRGAAALKFVGDGATFTSASQAVTTLKPNTLYAANLFLRLSALTGTGVLRVRLDDGSGGTVADDQAAANSFTVAATSLTTSYAAFSGVFRTPRVLPATVKLVVELSSALPSGKTLYIDSLALAPMTQLYAGGPALAVFRGAADFAAGDRFLVTVSNDRAGVSYGGTWQSCFQRYFGTDGLEFLLPYSGSPTVADSLITS